MLDRITSHFPLTVCIRVYRSCVLKLLTVYNVMKFMDHVQYVDVNVCVSATVNLRSPRRAATFSTLHRDFHYVTQGLLLGSPRFLRVQRSLVYKSCSKVSVLICSKTFQVKQLTEINMPPKRGSRSKAALKSTETCRPVSPSTSASPHVEPVQEPTTAKKAR